MLNEKQKKCIVLMITSNKTQKQIANEIQVSENTICEWKKDKEFKDEIQKQMQENFGLLAIEAQRKLKKLLNSKNENIQIQAIKDILEKVAENPMNDYLKDREVPETEEKVESAFNKWLDTFI